MADSIRLDELPGALSGTIIVGDGRTWTATEGTGNTWPASTRLRVEDHAGGEQVLTPVIVGTLATWTLTVAEALALSGTKTSGSLHARITTGTGDALRPWAAGRISIVSAYVGSSAAQSLGTVTLGPAGPGVAAGGAAGQALVKTSGADYATHWLTLTDTLVRFLDTNGDPLPAGSLVTIKINTATSEIDDITYQEA